MEKDQPKRPSERQLPGAQEKTGRAITPVAEAVHVPAHLAPPQSLQPKQLCHFYAQSSLGQRCHRQKKSLVSMHAGSLQSYTTLPPCEPWPASFSVRGFSRQEYWSVLGNTGCHTLLLLLLLLLSRFSRIQLCATPWTVAH